MSVVLIPGGLWIPATPAMFWTDPGITGHLQVNREVVTVERATRPVSWQADVDHVIARLPDGPLTLVAGSNACTIAVRLVKILGARVERVLLAWPATCGDPEVNARTRTMMLDDGANAATVDDLLGGGVLRGVDDDALTLPLLTAILPTTPPNQFHQRHTVDGLLGLVPGAVELPGSPEPPVPGFAAHLDGVCATLDAWLDAR